MQQESFSALKESITELTNKEIGSYLNTKEYDQDSVQEWTSTLSENLIRELKSLSSNFKFCVTVMILQKGDAGMHMSSTCYWDCNQDGSASIKWENASMYCIVMIFGVTY